MIINIGFVQKMIVIVVEKMMMKHCKVIKIGKEDEPLIEADIPDTELQNFLDHFDKDGYKVQVREHTEKDTEEFWKDVTKSGRIL